MPQHLQNISLMCSTTRMIALRQPHIPLLLPGIILTFAETAWASSQSLMHTCQSASYTLTQCRNHLQLLSAFLRLCNQVPVGMLVLCHLFSCFGQLPLSNSKSSAHHWTVLSANVGRAGLYHAMHSKHAHAEACAMRCDAMRCDAMRCYALLAVLLTVM